jgi:hypothetical protein
MFDYNVDKGKKLFPEIISCCNALRRKSVHIPFMKMVINDRNGSFRYGTSKGIAYGNKFLRGYKGSDRSETGVGLDGTLY